MGVSVDHGFSMSHLTQVRTPIAINIEFIDLNDDMIFFLVKIYFHFMYRFAIFSAGDGRKPEQTMRRRRCCCLFNVYSVRQKFSRNMNECESKIFFAVTSFQEGYYDDKDYLRKSQCQLDAWPSVNSK